MNQREFVAYVLGAIESLGIESAVVGSFASSYYGEPRHTRDLDVVVRLPRSRVNELCAQFPGPDWYVSREAAHEAVRDRRQFNVIHTTSGNKVDFMVARDDEWSELQFSRRQVVELVDGCEATAAHPEDVILGKLLYFEEGGSDRHLRDIAGILQVSGDLVDWDRLEEWAAKLGVVDHWRAIVEKLRDQPEPPDIPF